VQRIGPQKWLSFQVFTWGMIALFQAFQKGLGGYLTTRLLLGLAEAGFIPGGLYFLSIWYTRRELPKRVAIYFTGNMLATALSGVLAAGILQLRGKSGLAGWQWLFVRAVPVAVCY
jgi:MFS family permease